MAVVNLRSLELELKIAQRSAFFAKTEKKLRNSRVIGAEAIYDDGESEILARGYFLLLAAWKEAVNWPEDSLTNKVRLAALHSATVMTVVPLRPTNVEAVTEISTYFANSYLALKCASGQMHNPFKQRPEEDFHLNNALMGINMDCLSQFMLDLHLPRSAWPDQYVVTMPDRDKSQIDWLIYTFGLLDLRD